MRPAKPMTPAERVAHEKWLRDNATEIAAFNAELLTGATETSPGVFLLDPANLKRMGLG